MTLHTKLCDLLGVKHPVMLAGMGGVSYAELVAAVTNAGGYGVLGMAGQGPDFIRAQMRKVRSLRKSDMVRNAALPRIEVDPRTFECRADGKPLHAEPATRVPLSRKYLLR